MAENKTQRRDFLKLAGLGAIAATLGAKLVPSTALAADPGPMSPKDPMAVQLGYVEDAAKVDKKKWPKRDGAEGAKQFCYNCMFYQSKDDPKKSKAAPCQIFAGKSVKSKGWCNSWTLNPNVKD
ncbi:MAG: high-potential iron-sulfur protein [Bdellovibrionota bacterium]